MIYHLLYKKNKSVFLLTCGMITFLSCYMLISVSKIHNTIFYSLVLFPLLFCAERKHFIALHKSKLMNGFLLFLFYSTCTTFWSEFFSLELLFRTFKRVLYIYGLFLALYIIIENFSSFPGRLLQFSSLLLSIFSCICIFLFLTESGPHFLHDPIRMWGLGALYHPSFYSVIFLAMTMGLAARYYIEDNHFQPFKGKHFISLIMIILAIIVAILCDSRSAVVSFLTMVVFYALIERKFYWISIAFISVTLGFSFIWYINSNIFIGRTAYRFDIWSVFLDKWKECGYFFGCGMSGWKTTIIQAGETIHMHAHSIYISQLHTGGIIQLLGYMSILLCFLYEATLDKESRPWAIILVAGMTMTLFDGNKILTTPSPLWITLLIPMSIILSISVKNSKILPNN